MAKTIYECCESNDFEGLRELLQALSTDAEGLDVQLNWQDEDGDTAVGVLCLYEYGEEEGDEERCKAMLDLLIAAGADLDVKNHVRFILFSFLFCARA